MDCSANSSRAEAGRAFAVGSLLATLATIPDGRKRRGVRYTLPIVLGILTLAKLAGQDHPMGMAQWAHERAACANQRFGADAGLLTASHAFLRVRHKAVPVEDLDRIVNQILAQQPPPGLAAVGLYRDAPRGLFTCPNLSPPGPQYIEEQAGRHFDPKVVAAFWAPRMDERGES